MRRIIENIKAGYRLTFNREKQEQFVWETLKNFFDESKLDAYIDNELKFLSSKFKIGNGFVLVYYNIRNGYFSCDVDILENYPEEDTTELFILTTHFNNFLKYGIILVNVHEQNVTYRLKKEIIMPLLHPEIIHEWVRVHLYTLRDLQSYYLKLIHEKESPALIIADAINKTRKDAA
jgi:hypothetical protein